MLGKGEYNSWMGALKLKDALMEANDRETGGNSANSSSGATIAGFYGLTPVQRHNLRIPLFTEDDSIFANRLIKQKEKAPTISADIEKGTLIQYKVGNKSTYGIVIEPPIFAKNKGAYLKEVNKEQIEELEKQKNRKKLVITEESLKDLKEKANLIQRIIFSIKTHYEKFREFVLLIYLAVIIGGLIYILSLLSS